MLRKRIGRITAAVALAVSLLAGAVPASVAADTACQQLSLPVTLSASDPTVYHVFGQLCWQGNLAGKTVQLLASGFSYDHTYWDFPLQPQHYSYVRTATDAGYATLNIDRIGLGNSDHPPADSVTLPAEAYVNHQLIQALRHGDIAGTPFSKVIGVGHSFGSGVTVYEAATYADVDGVVVTGLMHNLNPAAAGFFAQIYPAQQDPKFAAAGLPLGYVTTRPGGRAPFFYNTAYADPAVIAEDEALKATGTSGELATFGMSFDTSLSQQIRVPVLLVVGQQDLLFCDEATPGLSCADNQTVAARESGAYSPQACLETFVLDSSGHDVNLHPDAHLWFEQAASWADRRVGNALPPTQPC